MLCSCQKHPFQVPSPFQTEPYSLDAEMTACTISHMTSEDSFESYYVLGTLFRNDRPEVTTCCKQLRDKLSSSNHSVKGRLGRCIGGQS